MFCFFYLEDFEPSENYGNQEDGQNYIDNEDYITDEKCSFSGCGLVLTFYDFHYCEECCVKVYHHVKPDVDVELELNHCRLHPVLETSWSSIELRHHKNKDIRYDDQHKYHDVEKETLS